MQNENSIDKLYTAGLSKDSYIDAQQTKALSAASDEMPQSIFNQKTKITLNTSPGAFLIDQSYVISSTGTTFYGNSAGNPQQFVSSQIASVKSMMDASKNAYEAKVARYEKDFNNLIISFTDLSAKEKEEYLENCDKLAKIRKDLTTKEQKQKQIKEKMDLAKAELDYLKKQKKDNSGLIEDYTKMYEGYSKEYSDLSSEIKEYSKQIKQLNSAQEKLLSKLSSKNKDFAQKRKEYKKNLEQAKAEYDNNQNNFRKQLNSLEQTQSNVFSKIQNYNLSNSYVGTPANYTYDAGELHAKWKEKWTKDFHGEAKANNKIASLGGSAFFNKVCDIANRLNCDPNALMGLMNSESGIRADIQNAAGSKAVGLIQFMPSTAKALGTTTEELKSMSAVEQLDYVEKYINYAKKIGGIDSSKQLDAGTLYTLVFLPAYSNRNILTSQGEKFYSANKGLDVNKDGQITKADMANRIQRFMA